MPRLIAVLALLLSSAQVLAAVSDARVALEKGAYPEALSILTEHLRRKPEDANARFLRGLTLTLMDRDGEATQVFADLVRDHPELPEPYNNLAVLYARAGKYENAKDALETAIIKHPSYATAHENLGDVYATMAQAAWKRAEVLDRNNTALADKLAQMDLILAGGVISAGARPAAVATAPLPTSAPPARAAAVAPTQAPVTAADRRASVPVPVMAPVIGSAPTAATAPRAMPPAEQSAAALRALQSWADAWSAQDVNRYLAAYSARFLPDGGLALDTWRQQRRARLTAPTSISIQILNPEVRALNDNVVAIRFVQVYQSNSYADQTLKEIHMAREGDNWRIVQEILAP